MDNLEEIDKFLEKYNFPNLNQEYIENLNRPIANTATITLRAKPDKDATKKKTTGQYH